MTTTTTFHPTAFVTSTSVNATITSITATTTVAGSNVAVAVVGEVNEWLLTEDIVMGASLVVGLCIAALGRELPTLLAGALMLAVFFGMLMKSAQDGNADLSQWIFWPIIVIAMSFVTMSGLMCIRRLRHAIVAVLTGTVLAVASAAAFVAIGVHVEGWSITLIVFVVFLVLGAALGFKLNERPTFHAALSATIGAFLVASGVFWFVRGHDMVAVLADAIVRADGSKEQAQAAAKEVRLMVAAWLGLMIAMSQGRYFAVKYWRGKRGEDAKLSADVETAHGASAV